MKNLEKPKGKTYFVCEKCHRDCTCVPNSRGWEKGESKEDKIYLNNQMTDEQILQSVIEKAKKNGWNTGFYFPDHLQEEDAINYAYMVLLSSHDFAKAFWNENDRFYCPACRAWKDIENKESVKNHYESIEVMKGWFLCGVCKEDDKTIPEAPLLKWQYHLKQMVLEENPIQYLEQFL